MIECIFTLDYEIYGDGRGSLQDLVYKPTEQLAQVFRDAGCRFVPFVEAAELDVIEQSGRDDAIGLVRHQLRQFYREGFTPGLHLHPQWYGARYEGGRWILDYSEYNLCTLSRSRIAEIVDRAVAYLRGAVDAADFTPLAFRAGNWLFQPTRTAASVLYDRGIRIDSSVFKGGVRHEHGLDYRRALDNGYFWRFTSDADVADPRGTLVEMPIFTQMVPFWKLSTSKRFVLERQNLATGTWRKRLNRVRDVGRLWHPLKFDFCRMTLRELTGMVEGVIREDREAPDVLRPLVAIGHSKELVDLDTIAHLLRFLRTHGIAVSTFEDVYAKSI